MFAWTNTWVALTAVWVHVAASAPLYDLDKSKFTPWEGDPRVLLVHDAAGLTRASTSEAIAELVRDNLNADLAPYTVRQAGASGRDWAQLLQRIAQRAKLRRSTAALLVRSNNITVITFRQFSARFQPHVTALVQSLRQHVQSRHLNLPDTLLLFNTRDEALCQPWKGMEQPCPVLPVFSHHKQLDSPPRGSPSQQDLLVPYFIHSQDHLVWFPPQKKIPHALLRAGLHRLMGDNSCRYQLSLLAAKQGVNQTGLDAGIVSSTWDKALPFAQVPFVDLEAHARWKLLVSCDGNSASARLGKLLAINSVVLKQDSPFLEWYYRSLREGTHYLGFNVDNITKVLQQCDQLPDILDGIASIANRFAYQYLSSLSRAVYWAEAMNRYNQLFKPGELSRLMSSVPSDVFNMDLMQLVKLLKLLKL